MEERKMRPRPRRSRRKVCKFCVEKATGIDYKDLKKLSGLISETGKMMPRRASGVCAKQQRDLDVSIESAGGRALLPFAGESSESKRERNASRHDRLARRRSTSGAVFLRKKSRP